MKAKDLMIGDWVLTKSSDGEDTHYIKVRDIGEHGINMCGFLEFDEIEPIPLTPEILEKNGFEGIKEGRFPSLRNYYNDIIFQLEGIKEEGNCKILYIFKDIPILYVHELQHALRLCKIDKEIVI